MNNNHYTYILLAPFLFNSPSSTGAESILSDFAADQVSFSSNITELITDSRQLRYDQMLGNSAAVATDLAKIQQVKAQIQNYKSDIRQDIKDIVRFSLGGPSSVEDDEVASNGGGGSS